MTEKIAEENVLTYQRKKKRRWRKNVRKIR